MRNQFAGTCYRCGQTVEPGAGHFERIPFGGWRVQHADCAIQYRGTDHGKPGAKEQLDALRLARLKRDAQMTGKKGQRARHRLKQEGICA